MKYVIHTDGGARGNPGPAAVGVVIEKVLVTEKGNQLHIVAEFGKKIGETTNNTAEYVAVIEALKYFTSQPDNLRPTKNDIIDFYLDSTLVVNQLNGLYKVKQPHLRELLMTAHVLEAEVATAIRYAVIPREQNARADFFVNHALDS